MVNLLGIISLKNKGSPSPSIPQFSIASQSSVKTYDHLSLYAGMLIGLLLGMYCAGKHSYYAFICIKFMAYPEDTVLHFPVLTSYSLSASSSVI